MRTKRQCPEQLHAFCPPPISNNIVQQETPHSVPKGLKSRGVEAQGLEIWTRWAPERDREREREREVMVVMTVVIVVMVG